MSRKEYTDFIIDIYKLSNTNHDYEFEIGDTFFEGFTNSPVEKGQLKGHLMLDKTERMITANVHLEGTVELMCDRSLEFFQYPIETRRRVFYKYGDTEEELDDDIYQILPNRQQIDFSQLLFEFIILEIPMKKIHPRFADSPDDEGIIYTSGDEMTEEEEKEADPRWEALKKLKN